MINKVINKAKYKIISYKRIMYIQQLEALNNNSNHSSKCNNNSNNNVNIQLQQQESKT